MKRLNKVLATMIAGTMLVASQPCVGAPAMNARTTYPHNDGSEFDGQAYAASRYVPSLRPQVVIGILTLTGIIVLVLQNNQSGSGHSHS